MKDEQNPNYGELMEVAGDATTLEDPPVETEPVTPPGDPLVVGSSAGPVDAPTQSEYATIQEDAQRQQELGEAADDAGDFGYLSGS